MKCPLNIFFRENVIKSHELITELYGYPLNLRNRKKCHATKKSFNNYQNNIKILLFFQIFIYKNNFE